MDNIEVIETVQNSSIFRELKYDIRQIKNDYYGDPTHVPPKPGSEARLQVIEKKAARIEAIVSFFGLGNFIGFVTLYLLLRGLL